MFCPNCGSDNSDGSAFCQNCGAAMAPATAAAPQGAPVNTTPYPQNASNPYGQGVPGQQPYVQGTPYPQQMSQTDTNLRMAAFIFNLISTIIGAFAIIPLAWMIPMTVHSWGIYKGTKDNTVCFGVCTLLFVSLVGGILLLCSKKER